ncbi:hypothetical protein EJB05_23932, partial [Eragrostis curvula]
MQMPEPAAAARCSGHPASCVLLDTIGRNDFFVNATTAGTVTSAGWLFEVTFELVDPPSLSRCFFRYAGPPTSGRSGNNMTSVTVTVSGADGAFLLVRLGFPEPGFTYRTAHDVFVYRAGPGAPSLQLVPPRPDRLSRYPINLLSGYVAVLSCDDDGHCLVVVPKRQHEPFFFYHLDIFSTKAGSWSEKIAKVADDTEPFYGGKILPSRVFSVDGGGLMAWVDVRHGILLCNVLDEDPQVRMIELPPLSPVNKHFGTEMDLNSIRDVAFSDGSFRFIELEHPDSDDDNPEQYRWTANMFKRTVDPQDSWELCGTVDSAELSPADSCFPDLCPPIWDEEEKRLTLDEVLCQYVTLNMYRDDVAYIKGKLDARDPDGWVLAVDTRNNKLERVQPFSEMVRYVCTVLQCDLSKYLSKGSRVME